MRTTGMIVVGIFTAFGAGLAAAQQPASALDRGSSLQAWQHPDYQDLVARCETPPQPFRIGDGTTDGGPPPPLPFLPTSTAIPDVVAAGQEWQIVWSWEGNNADGPIAGEGDRLIFANNDASNVMELDLDTGLATIIHDETNTGGAVSRNKNGELFVLARGLNASVQQLEPERRIRAGSYRGEPIECVGGVPNDLAAAANGHVYFTVTGAGVFGVDADGEVSQYGEGLQNANGIVLSPDETTLYATNGAAVVAFDIRRDGQLLNQREFAVLPPRLLATAPDGDPTGRLYATPSGDGSAVDQQGRLYVSTGSTVEVFAPDGAHLGSIPGPEGLHGVAFGGADRQTLYAIVFYGVWGTPSARNLIIGMPMLAPGYTGRAK